MMGNKMVTNVLSGACARCGKRWIDIYNKEGDGYCKLCWPYRYWRKRKW